MHMILAYEKPVLEGFLHFAKNDSKKLVYFTENT